MICGYPTNLIMRGPPKRAANFIHVPQSLFFHYHPDPSFTTKVKATFLQEQARHDGTDAHGFDSAHAHADCFLASGAKILEGYGKHVVIAVGQRSYNGRIMTGISFHRPLLLCPPIVAPVF